jgi:hypothetical protein
MAFKRDNPGCPCCGIDCICLEDIGDNPTLLIEFFLIDAITTYRTCLQADEEENFYDDCFVAEINTNLAPPVASVSFPLIRVCDGVASHLLVDAEESFVEVSWTGDVEVCECPDIFGTPGNCLPGTLPSEVEYIKSINTVRVSYANRGRVLFPLWECSPERLTNEIDWSQDEFNLVPPETPPGECVSVPFDYGYIRWTIVPDAS